MNIYRPSCVVAAALIATQILGPAVLWAADQRGIRVEANRRMVIAAISGDQLAAQSGGNTKTLHFLETVTAGDQLATGDRTIAEVLIGNRAVVTLGQSTTAQFTAVGEQVATVQVTKGIVRVAASAAALGEQGMIVVHTPTCQVQTRGGIIRVMVDAPVGSTDHMPVGEARPYRASYGLSMMVAAVSTRGEIIQVEEGIAEILGAGPGGKTLTVKSGQSVTMQSGQAGSIAGLVSQGGLRAGVLASAGHSSTPKEGIEHLVALQVNQATALGKALTGEAETGAGQSGGKEDGRNALNGATGGVVLASNSILVNSLFGGGSTANTASRSPLNSTGAGFGGANSNGYHFTDGEQTIPVNGGTALLVFTKKEPVKAIWIGSQAELQQSGCSDGLSNCLLASDLTDPSKVATPKQTPVLSNFSVAKELLLAGGSSNIGHGGSAPTQTLIVRGATTRNVAFSFGLGGLALETSLGPIEKDGFGFEAYPLRSTFIANDSTFVVKEGSSVPGAFTLVGGTLGQFSNRLDGLVFQSTSSYVDGAITATGASVILSGGVTLDRGTQATISTTEATNNYFSNANLSSADAKYSGSLLAVINGPDGPTSLTMEDRMLGVYDGSKIDINPIDPNIPNAGNKALLSVLDARLTGPQSLGAKSVPLIDIDAAFLDDGVTKGVNPTVTVTSAVVTRSTIPLDGALLTASAPLLALTNATMTTISHFADLAGNQNQALVFNGSLVRGDALVALNAATLTIQSGHFLNLNNATASITGYLFSLTGGSTLNLNNGTLFSLTTNSSLNLTGNAFGVFGSGTNTLSIANNLCPPGACGQLVNSANQPFLVNVLVNGGTPLQVAGVTHNVVLPNDFNVFALVPGAPTPHVNIGATDALFKVDGTSTLTINGTTVVQ